MNDVKLSHFNLPRKVSLLFEKNGWVSGESLVYNLELYKFATREKIIQVMNDNGMVVEDIKLLPVISNSAPLYSKVMEIERESPVICDITGKDSIRFIANAFNRTSVERLAVQVSVSNVEVVYVTPRNFEILKTNTVSEWDFGILLRRIVLDCMESKGRDIHFGVRHVDGLPEYYIEYRVAENLEPCKLFKLDKELNKELIFSLISHNTNSYELDLNSKEGVTTSVVDLFGDGEVALRVSAMKVKEGYKCVCRIQQVTTTSLKIPELGFSEDVQEDLYFVSNKMSGLTLITGAINTGKNTTAFAMANEMAMRPISMVDYSSPIEILMPFDQVDYGGDPKYLKELTRLAKKQDLNVVFINELPDVDVAMSAMDLVNSSVHVITTLHVHRIWHLPHKLKQFFGPEFKSIFFQLNGCFNQKMYKKQCTHCRRKAAVSEIPNKRYRAVLEANNVEFYWETDGCEYCEGDSKQIRIQPYTERFVMDEELLSEILKVDQTYEMEQIIKKYVCSRNHHLEYVLSKTIENGDLSVDSLKSIV